MQTTRASIIHKHAFITRGDLLATPKYFQQHKALGHLPQNIIQVSGVNKKRLLSESGIAYQADKRVYLIQDKSVQYKKAKNTHDRHLG